MQINRRVTPLNCEKRKMSMANNGNNTRGIRTRSYTVDENGEVLDFSETTKITGPTDSYVKIYSRVWDLDVIDGVLFSFVMDLVGRMSFADNGQIVELRRGDKLSLKRKFGWKDDRTVERALNGLIGAGILRRINRGIYQVNPYMFAKGRQSDIDALRTRYTMDTMKKNEREE